MPMKMFGLAAGLALCATAALADPALDALVTAYPEQFAGFDAHYLIWKDGTRMPISDGAQGKTFEQLLDASRHQDMFAIPYPLGADAAPPAPTKTPAASATRPSSARCTATAARARCRRAKPSPGCLASRRQA